MRNKLFLWSYCVVLLNKNSPFKMLMQVVNQAVVFMVVILYGMDHIVNVANFLMLDIVGQHLLEL